MKNFNFHKKQPLANRAAFLFHVTMQIIFSDIYHFLYLQICVYLQYLLKIRHDK
jgi:hypothetical protein